MRRSRRDVLLAGASAVVAPLFLPFQAVATPQLRVTGFDLLAVRATARTVWLVVRLRTDAGLVGLGEASDAFGFANTTVDDTARMRTQLSSFFECHSFFDVDAAVRLAERLEPYNLTWYEEPVPPERVDDTVTIKQRIRQPMAGGEVLFGLSGFTPLVRRRAVDTIMPDVKHCGGLLELTRIAAMAADEGVMVAPHNPSGPVSTAASVQALRRHEERELPRTAIRRSELALRAAGPARAIHRRVHTGA